MFWLYPSNFLYPLFLGKFPHELHRVSSREPGVSGNVVAEEEGIIGRPRQRTGTSSRSPNRNWQQTSPNYRRSYSSSCSLLPEHARVREGSPASRQQSFAKRSFGKQFPSRSASNPQLVRSDHFPDIGSKEKKKGNTQRKSVSFAPEHLSRTLPQEEPYISVTRPSITDSDLSEISLQQALQEYYESEEEKNRAISNPVMVSKLSKSVAELVNTVSQLKNESCHQRQERVCAAFFFLFSFLLLFFFFHNS